MIYLFWLLAAISVVSFYNVHIDSGVVAMVLAYIVLVISIYTKDTLKK